MTKFQNRIIGSGIEPLDQIQFNPRNWRIHPLNQQNALKGVLDEVGWVQEVIINKRTGNLVDGHLRCQLAAREGEKEIPVKYVDLSEEEEALIISTIDPIAAMATTDKSKLDDLFRDIQSDNENVQKLISEIADKEHLEYGKRNEDSEPQIDRAAELNEKWQVKTGDLFQIGEHRLLCGDSTKREDVERVMGGEKAVCMWTDPPYGVEYVGKTKDALTIENDSAENLQELLSSVFSVADSILEEGAPIYVAHPAGVLQMVFDKCFVDVGWKFHETLVWVKDSMVIGHSDYHYKHEHIIYGWKGKNRFWYSGRDQVSVFEIARPKRSSEHPTMKPPELVQACLQNSTMKDDITYEPFCGSGTTMVACENLHRKCRAIEISPNYCAVILERMQTAFPELEIKRIE